MPVATDEKLLIACWSTTIILVIMAIVFRRGNRRNLVWAVAPLILPPAMHIFSRQLALAFAPSASIQTRIILDLSAALVACVLIGFANGLVSKTKRIRIAYLVCGMLFVLAFSGVLIMNSVNQMNLFPVA